MFTVRGMREYKPGSNEFSFIELYFHTLLWGPVFVCQIRILKWLTTIFSVGLKKDKLSILNQTELPENKGMG